MRSFTPADRPRLLAVVDAVCAERTWMHTRRYEPTPAWEHALSRPRCACHLLLVAVDAHDVVGWCRAFPVIAGVVAEVGIGLLPAYRDHGWGTDMLHATVAWAQQAGLRELVLTVRADNARARHVFTKVGFRPTGVQEGEWEHMVCALEPERLPSLARERRTRVARHGASPYPLDATRRAGRI
ncbi:MAG: GNAT family N-acetyltransferase [Ardenticatenia bacterium]|nr:GNAT family N-acetyltransferase [Ardenticatenia bacterium]